MRRLPLPALFSALALLAASIGAAQAQSQGQAGSRNCEPEFDLLDMAAGTAAPRLQSVAPGATRVHFLKSAHDQAGCPDSTEACRARAYLVPGNSVIVTRVAGDYACAAFVGAAPKYRVTGGWLPRAALADAPPASLAPAEWTGAWQASDEQDIAIKPAAGDRIAIDGSATWGGHDPARIARGGVHEGEIGGEATPRGQEAALVYGDNGEPLPESAASAAAPASDADNCRVRLWRLGAYLVVADNIRCGGLNVTFTGIYHRVTGKK